MTMKKILFVFCIFLFSQFSVAQSSDSYKIKAECIYGSIKKHNDHLKNIVANPVTGAEIAIEWQRTDGWHKYFNFPYVGVGATFLDLGNPYMLGYAFAVYPYMNIPLIRHERFSVNIKPGAGISYVTKSFDDFREDVISGKMLYKKSNAAIGSNLNVYFSGGLNLEVPVTDKISFTADYSWNHISNGMIKAPNSGINMINAFVGLKYLPNHSNRRDYYLRYYPAPDIPRDITVEITASGGVRQRYYRDDKSLPIASLAVGVYKPLTNYYRMGVGADLFYDGIFTSGLNPGYKRTYVSSDELKNKVRLGISWQNELLIGKLIAGIHAGIYLYDPVKNMEPYIQAQYGGVHKGLIYPYDIEQEDGWMYTRFSAKYMITRHIYAAIGLKSHLQKAEFIEWGLGYRY